MTLKIIWSIGLRWRLLETRETGPGNRLSAVTPESESRRQTSRPGVCTAEAPGPDQAIVTSAGRALPLGGAGTPGARRGREGGADGGTGRAKQPLHHRTRRLSGRPRLRPRTRWPQGPDQRREGRPVLHGRDGEREGERSAPAARPAGKLSLGACKEPPVVGEGGSTPVGISESAGCVRGGTPQDIYRGARTAGCWSGHPLPCPFVLTQEAGVQTSSPRLPWESGAGPRRCFPPHHREGSREREGPIAVQWGARPTPAPDEAPSERSGGRPGALETAPSGVNLRERGGRSADAPAPGLQRTEPGQCGGLHTSLCSGSPPGRPALSGLHGSWGLHPPGWGSVHPGQLTGKHTLATFLRYFPRRAKQRVTCRAVLPDNSLLRAQLTLKAQPEQSPLQRATPGQPRQAQALREAQRAGAAQALLPRPDS